MNADLLRVMQSEFPLAADPWTPLGERFGLAGGAVRDAVAEHVQAGRIRRIGAVFDLAAFGYAQALIALASGGDPDGVGARAGEHPGVSHCYRREHKTYDVWLTLAVSPDSRLGLERSAELLADRAGAREWLLLPTVRRLKLSVRFRPDGPVLEAPAAAPTSPPEPVALDDEIRRAARALRRELPIGPDPFAAIASDEGLTVERLLDCARRLQAGGAMRRYGAVLAHQALGVSANALGVWSLPDEQADALADRAAEELAVSHCYLRPPRPGWPFNLYTMLHGRQRADVLAAAERLSDRLGRAKHQLLWTLAEYRKTPVVPFDPAEAEWEKASS